MTQDEKNELKESLNDVSYTTNKVFWKFLPKLLVLIVVLGAIGFGVRYCNVNYPLPKGSELPKHGLRLISAH